MLINIHEKELEIFYKKKKISKNDQKYFNNMINSRKILTRRNIRQNLILSLHENDEFQLIITIYLFFVLIINLIIYHNIKS